MAQTNINPWCPVCGWRKGGVDSWDGVRCKCGLYEPPMETLDEDDEDDECECGEDTCVCEKPS